MKNVENAMGLSSKWCVHAIGTESQNTAWRVYIIGTHRVKDRICVTKPD